MKRIIRADLLELFSRANPIVLLLGRSTAEIVEVVGFEHRRIGVKGIIKGGGGV
jgi:hypothetical protein